MSALPLQLLKMLKPPRPLELMQLHVRALFQHDENARLTAINQWTGGRAPLFFLGRSLRGNLWRFHKDLPESLVTDLSRLCLKETGNILDAPIYLNDYQSLLEAYCPDRQVWQGPAYYRKSKISGYRAGTAITQSNKAVVEKHLNDWLADIPYWQPFMVSLENGQAVAVCATVRRTKDAAEAGVETATGYRRKGHAARAVASWTNAILEKGLIPLYSTSWDNKASQAIANKLGFSLFGSDFSIT